MASSVQCNGQGGTVEQIYIRLPRNYPPLESVLDVYLPLHFTWTRVDPINDAGDLNFVRMNILKAEILRRLEVSETHLNMVFGYGRPCDSGGYARGPCDDLSAEDYDTRHPRVFAVFASPRDMCEIWRIADGIIRGGMIDVFGHVPVQIRYYYCSYVKEVD